VAERAPIANQIDRQNHATVGSRRDRPNGVSTWFAHRDRVAVRSRRAETVRPCHRRTP